MKTQPKISIIMPCYNVEKYIVECLESVFNQTFTNYEVIAVNDGSTDKTLEILNKYSKTHKNLKVVTQKNKGAGAARNNGLKIASGTYVLFLDPDDFLQNGFFAAINAITEKEPADIYFYNFNTFDDKTKETQEQILFKNLDSSIMVGASNFKYSLTTFEQRKEFFIWSYVAPWNKVYNRQFILDNDLKFDELFSTNDRTFYFSSLVKSAHLVMMDAILINYRINNSESLTGTYNETKFNNRILAYNSTIKFIDKKDKILNESFFKVSILDFILFLHKATEKDKLKIFLKTIEFFKTIDISEIDCVRDQNDKFGFWYNLIVNSDYLVNIKERDIVPVVFATNENYAPYLSVAIESLIKNCSPNKFYDIYVFHSSLSELTQFKLKSQSTNNVHIRTLNVLPIVNDIKMYSKGYYSVEMYYRILIPEILYHYKKAVYLDCDIVIENDVSKLYDTDVSHYTLAAIQNDLVSKEMIDYVKNVLKLDTEKYFNSGVLVLNIDKFVSENIKEQCFNILSKFSKLACPDQDILNLSCFGETLYLDNTWNFQTECKLYTNEDKYSKKHNIVHYITGNKPWNTKNMALAEVFWKYARNAPFYEDIIATYLKATLKIQVEQKSVDSPKRNVINNSGNNLHPHIINFEQLEHKTLISWPFRMCKKFFQSLKRNGLKETIKKTKIKLKYVVNRMLGRVDKYNNQKNSNIQNFVSNKSYEYFKNLPIKKYSRELEQWYNNRTKSNMDIHNPKTFNEKIQWLKINDSTLLKSHLTDKYLAKEYIKSVIGEKYVIKTLGVYDKFEDINFAKLPNKFVIKSTHGSGQIIIVKDKSAINIKDLQKTITNWLLKDYSFVCGFEIHYGNIIPRIIVEEFIEGMNDDLYDYKFMCINGKVEFVWVDSDRFKSHKRNLYNTNWELLPVKYRYDNSEHIIQKPIQLNKLIRLSEKLAKNFALVRCDFYVLPDNSIKFGEMTFTSCSGMDKWSPIDYDTKFGEMLQLPKPTKFKKLSRKEILKSEREFLDSLKKEK